jgi:hypothetical protein
MILPVGLPKLRMARVTGKAWIVLFTFSYLTFPMLATAEQVNEPSASTSNKPEYSDFVGHNTLYTVAKVRPEREISFVVMSHIYPLLFGGKESDVDRVVKAIKNSAPDILILGGDIIRGTWNVPRWEPDEFEGEQDVRQALNDQWNRVLSIFKNLRIPIWVAPGNHDISSYTSRYRNVAREVFINRVGRPFYKKRVGGYDFIFLNTILSDGHGIEYGLDEAQVEWLKGELTSSEWEDGFLVRMAVSNWMEEVHPILSGKVKFVFAGDGGDRDNFLFYEIRDGIHYYVNGSGRNGVSFLHVVAGPEGVKINPYFLDIQSTDFHKIDKERSFLQNSGRKVFLLLRNKSFWAGVVGSYLLMGLIVLVFKRNSRWFQRS